MGYHFYNDFHTLPEMLAQVRRTYDGPLAMATDYMVFNVTKDDIRVRMAAVDPTRPKETREGVGDTLANTHRGTESSSMLRAEEVRAIDHGRLTAQSTVWKQVSGFEHSEVSS